MTKARSNATANAAKGDLTVGNGTNLSGVLSVSQNGDTIVADSSTSTGLRYQAPVNCNPILNSSFQVWQRGTTASNPNSIASTYIADRWNYYRPSGFTTGITMSRQTTSDTTNLPFIQYCARIQRAASNTSTLALYLAQNIESINSIPYAGKTVTLSFYARAGANFSATSSILNASLITGTGTDQNVITGLTGQTIAFNTNATLTTTWQRFSVTGSVGSTVTQIVPFFQYTPTGTAGADDYYEVTGVQVEVGSVATPFKTYAGTIQGELAACQRYYWRTTATGTIALGSGTTEDANRAWIMINNPVSMRVAPTSVDASTLTVTDATSYTLDVTSVTGIVFGTNGGRVTFNTSGGQTTNRAAFGQTKSTGGYIGFSAEL